MKVVLFCGGQGLRMRDLSGLPKPLMPLGNRPLIWHLMKYYAHWGHKDFILCLGYRGAAIKEYFVNYQEWLSNDFVLSNGGRDVELARRDLEDWRITFVDTGANANIGERLAAVRPHLETEPMFLANYSDGLTDCPLPAIIDRLEETNAVAACMTARSNTSMHFVRHAQNGLVTAVEDAGHTDSWVNAGFFAFRNEIFDYMRDGEELVIEPFRRLINARKLAAFPYAGFWSSCDTFKDLQTLEGMLARGPAPWELWRQTPRVRNQPPVLKIANPAPQWERLAV
jgi:glucose-1-phosphate cytidylyltransferase